MRSGYPDLIFVYRYMIIIVQLHLLKVLLTICSIDGTLITDL